MAGPIRATFEFLRRRKRNYQQVFATPMGQEVLKDLAKFCRAAESTYDDDPRRHALAEGRREVFLRIGRHLNLPTSELYAMYSGKPFDPLLMDQEDKEQNDA